MSVVANVLTVTYADGTTETFTLAAGGGSDVDQTARDAAAAAQGEIDTHEVSPHNTDTTARNAATAAQSEIDAHEASTHNTDITARSTARNARQTGEQAQTTIETHEASTHNTDTTARTAAGAAQTTANTARTELTAHEGTPHGGGGTTDQTARDSAAAAQSEIDAHEVTTHNTDTTARSTARNARQTAEQAQTGLETHEASTHNTDAGARTAAANAQSAVEDHGRTTHNTDTVARNAAAAAQTAAESAAAGGGRAELYKDTADYSRTTASTVFRQFDLSRAPARGKGLELVIANVARTIKTPLYVGTTDDFLDLTVLTTTQLNGVISTGTVPVANTIPVKSIALDESNSNSFGHGIVYVGRVNDTRMGVGLAQRRGVGERFRMTVREIP